MKRLIPISFFFFLALFTHAQITETVSIGSGYANQVWYSLDQGETGTAPKDNWDFAFEANGFTTSIRMNGVVGHSMWLYPNGDTTSWNNIDTSGIGNWNAVYNSDSTWGVGAFNRPADPADALDLGWGTYNMITHHVTGNRVFILETGSGTWKKLWILKLASGTYSFRIANLDGTNQIDRTLDKTNYNGKNFAYYSITDDQNLDREPIHSDWDLLFSQYPAVIPGFGPYPSTGILLNSGLEAAKVYPVNDPDLHTDTTGNYQPYLNTIGHNWKSYNFGSNSWDIADSTVYLVKDQGGNIWRLVMKGFGGSATGDYIFSKEKLYNNATGVAANDATQHFLSIFPNPAVNGNISVSFDLTTESSSATLRLLNLQGQTLWQEPIAKANGLQTNTYNFDQLASGMYFISLETTTGTTTKRLIVR